MEPLTELINQNTRTTPFAVMTRKDLQELYPDVLRRKRDLLIQQTVGDIYRGVKGVAQMGCFEYTHGLFGEAKELRYFVVEKLRELFPDVEIKIQGQHFKNPRTQRLVLEEDSLIRLVWL